MRGLVGELVDGCPTFAPPPTTDFAITGWGGLEWRRLSAWRDSGGAGRMGYLPAESQVQTMTDHDRLRAKKSAALMRGYHPQ